MHNHNAYKKLAIMSVLSFIAMYILMYAMVDSLPNVFSNVNQFYMAGLMTAPMILIELLVMGMMYPNRRRNIVIGAITLLVGVLFWFGIRTQFGVDDRQFLRSMIPHHGGAVLMCGKAKLLDPRVQELCAGIIQGQQQEIELMKQYLENPDVSSNESLPIAATVTSPSGQIITARVADDKQERNLGLSYFPSLPNDQGMLFLFQESGIYPFWMKGMNFPLDIIWLRKVSEGNFQVVSLVERVDPSTYPHSIVPTVDADAVLEINSGQASILGIREGNFLEIKM